MKILKALMLFLVVNGCSSTDEPLPLDEPFSVLINGELFTPDRSGSASYYKGKFRFGAIDTVDRVNNEEKFWILFKILNPELGVNSVDNSINTSSIQLHRWTGRLGSAFFATSGQFVLTEFDTINSIFSGTFNGIFDYPDHDIYYELRNGQFNGFSLSELFCEPELSLESPDSISLFNNWGLVGFKNSDGSYSYPPCGTESRIKITPDPSNSSIALLDGLAPINSFGSKYQILNDNTFVTDKLQAQE
jgi:hypothetical protein